MIAHAEKCFDFRTERVNGNKNEPSDSSEEEGSSSIKLAKSDSIVVESDENSGSASDELSSDNTLVKTIDSLGFQDTPWRRRKEEEEHKSRLQNASENFLYDYQKSQFVSDYHKHNILKIVKQKIHLSN